MLQGELFDDAEYVPRTEALEESIARARAYVRRKLDQRVCRDCCDPPTEWVHRARQKPHFDKPVARLVQVGATNARLAEEFAKCDPLCKRCALARAYRLWRATKASVGMVAKTAITTGSGRKRRLDACAKRAPIAPRKIRVA